MIAGRRTIVIVVALITAVFWGAPSTKASDYRAFSLNGAGKALQGGRTNSREARMLGGITRPVGCVFDEANRDVVIIGVADSSLPGLHIDELTVAIRAVLKHGESPLVSIDPAPKDAKPEDQVVRFAGKLENTQFGKDLLDADVVLKKLGLGKLNAEVWGVRSYFDLSVDEWHRTGNEDAILSRFWFVTDPDGSAVAARRGVGLVKRLKIKVQTEVAVSSRGGTDVASPVDTLGSAFADSLTAALGDVMLAMPELRRLDQLYRLVGMASIMERWRDTFGLAPDVTGLAYWLNDARVGTVRTPPTFSLLTSTAGGAPGKGNMMISGGVELRALVTDVRGGSLLALRDIVVKSRPSRDSLVWAIPIGDAMDIITDATGGSSLPLSRADASAGMHLLKGVSHGGAAANGLGSAAFQAAVFRASSVPLRDIGHSWRNEDLHVGGVPQERVGGIMLKGAATVVGADQGEASAARLFSLIAAGEGSKITREAHRRFVTALWSVYYSKEDPGISIDPIAWGVDKQLVRYIGRVVNTDLGRVMRDADYLMKKWAVGTEQPDIPGFRDVDTIAGRDGMTYADAFRRFWFVPEGMTFKTGEGIFLFDRGRVVLKTELMLEGKQTQVVASDQQFADFFTKNYEAIAAKYPIYNELFEYAKLVSIAKYLKEQGVPLHWYLMAHLDDVITEDSIGAVDTLSKGSQFLKDVRIEGGVEMHGRYVLDHNAATAIQKAVSRMGRPRDDPAAPTTPGSARAQPSDDRTISVEKQVFSIMPMQSVTCGIDTRGVRYQTDVAIRQGQEPGLELVRYFRPVVKGDRFRGEFGNGWHLLRPYRIVPVGKPEIPFLNILIPAKVAVRNLITGQDEILTFDDKKYELAGYRPANMNSSRIVGLFWTVVGGMRLVDKLGNEFWFNEGLMLSEVHFSDEFGMQFEYGYEEAGRETYDHTPYRLEREGTGVAHDVVAYGPDGEERPLPDKLRLTDLGTGDGKVFTFGERYRSAWVYL